MHAVISSVCAGGGAVCLIFGPSIAEPWLLADAIKIQNLVHAQRYSQFLFEKVY